MMNRIFHRRVSTLFAVVQATPAARVIDWPLLMEEKRARSTRYPVKSMKETAYANK